MTTLLYTHEACLDHDPGSYHPEVAGTAARRAGGAGRRANSPALERPGRPCAEIDEIVRVHTRDSPRAGAGGGAAAGHAALDADTVLSPRSGEAALRAVGAVCAAVDAVVAGEADNAFCAVRPPGHTRKPAAAMGFCLFNNVAIGAPARAAGARAGAGRGDRFRRPSRQRHAGDVREPIRTSSTPPPTSRRSIPAPAARSETGVGNIVNVPLRPMSGSAEFRHAFNELHLAGAGGFPARFPADFGGFRRPSPRSPGAAQLVEADYAWVTERLLACRGAALRAAGSSRRSRAATTSTPWRPAPRPMCGALLAA